jgi:parallel beta-helix repeat protein
LKDSVFTANNYGIDIGSVSGTTNDVVVTSCTVTNNTFGIFVTYAKGVKILESTVSNNKQNGISLYYSSDAYIENSTINMNAGDGISCYWVADNCTFIGNNITANLHDGIQFLDFNSTAARNHIVGNGRYGILVSGSNSLVYGNWIVANNDTGIEVLYSSNSTISSNVICNNTAYGLHIEGSNTDVKSSDNTIYDNLIGWNKAENALDDGSHNMWDNGTLGNAWSDYTGYGTYSVPGSAGSIDRFPRRLEVFPVTSNTNMDEFQPTALFLPLLASAGIGAALVVFLWYRRSSLEHAARVETALH